MNKTVKKILRSILILAILTFSSSFLMFFGMGGSLKNKEDVEAALYIILLIAIITPFALFFYFLIKIPFYLRTLRMEKLARELRLSFKKEIFLFKLDQPRDRKTNMIKGAINGHTVKIYDYMNIISLGRGYITLRNTFVSIDNKEYKLKGFILFPSTKRIKKFLNKKFFQEIK